MKMKTLMMACTLGALLLCLNVTPSYAASDATAQEASAAQAAQQTWTGKIEAKEMGGSTVYVFTVGETSYALSPQDKAADFVGKTVKITGTMTGNTVTISSIEEA